MGGIIYIIWHHYNYHHIGYYNLWLHHMTSLGLTWLNFRCFERISFSLTCIADKISCSSCRSWLPSTLNDATIGRRWVRKRDEEQYAANLWETAETRRYHNDVIILLLLHNSFIHVALGSLICSDTNLRINLINRSTSLQK